MNEITKIEKMDETLTRFFRAELPEPWPDCQVRIRPERPVARPRVRTAARWALAASVLLYFVSYLVLGGMFPRQLPGPVRDHRHDIGKGFRATPGGSPAAPR